MTEHIKPKHRYQLKSEFENLGLDTNQKIADALRFKKGTIDRLMRGDSWPGVELQNAIVKVLGINWKRLENLL